MLMTEAEMAATLKLTVPALVGFKYEIKNETKIIVISATINSGD
jgi:hypothetical protein